MKSNKIFKTLLGSLFLLTMLAAPLFINTGNAGASPADPPGYVSDFQVDYNVAAHGDVIYVSWGAPTDDGGSHVTGYKLSWSLHGADDFSDPISTTSTHYGLSTSDGLTKDKRYDIRVWAVNTAGDGIYDMIPWVLYGTQVYDITNCQQLQNINNDLWGDYTLANNIDCAETDGWTHGFEPIGGTNFGSDGFHGNFNGQGHSQAIRPPNLRRY